MSHEDCQLLFDAGQAMVEKSGLANYSEPCFIACDNESGLEEYWKEEFHPNFGRYMAWVLFSVGAENLAKAVCVCNKVLKVQSKPTLEHYVKNHFRKLCSEPGLCAGDIEDGLVKGYEYLVKVRNRDSHSYRKSVRRADFPLVKQRFVPAFNIVVKVMRHKGHYP